jgi:hypothetical protein
MNKTTWGLRALLIAAVAALLGTLTACSTYAPPDGLYLYYAAGTGETEHFQECIQPSQSGSYPVDDKIYLIPTSLRTWNVRADGHGDSKTPITSGTLPVVTTDENGRKTTQAGPEVNVWPTSDFFINTDCGDGKGKDDEGTGYKSPVVKFWEQTGRRYKIAEDGEDLFKVDNFRTMLLNTLVPAEEKALRQVTRKYDADVLDANTGDVWTAMENELQVNFQRELRAKLGGDFFCGQGYAGGRNVEWTEQVPTGEVDEATGLPKFEEKEEHGSCPPVRISIGDVSFKDSKIANARSDVYAAEQRAKAAKIDAQGQKERADILAKVGNSQGYLRLQEIEADKRRSDAQVESARVMSDACKRAPSCTVVVGASGNVNVPAGR